ncbi:cbb3-type cytochrome oxidase assembly protein CcoS [Sediminibacterium roseum]|uniref:Cbb3-type cytochrome oxidase assembly protein CcoS n=1 Tax=Sediminibacterium roseum TaxID=1978412 RepID=A0ABW9ZT87_9BACT|nr:cbb3-type cytochrome oxidase assembly protein CcoS [Sediminibacterium roseum]NCI50199.1 cbb3-type cytochrome oxidase assembly protein CcoS [Sediminibacterium roseum]
MSVIILLVLASLSIALVFLAGFLWSLRTGQYDDEAGDSVRILLDESVPDQHSQSLTNL